MSSGSEADPEEMIFGERESEEDSEEEDLALENEEEICKKEGAGWIVEGDEEEEDEEVDDDTFSSASDLKDDQIKHKKHLKLKRKHHVHHHGHKKHKSEGLRHDVGDREEDEEEEEEEDGEEKDHPRSKRRRDSDNDDDDDLLDEDDYQLLAENLGRDLRKSKRVRVETTDEEDESPMHRSMSKDRNKDKIAHEIFESDVESGSVHHEKTPQQAKKYRSGTEVPNFIGGSDEEEEEEEDEFADFLVDQRSKPKKKRTQEYLHADPMLRSAQDIFGIDVDFDELRNQMEGSLGGESETGSVLNDEQEDYDDAYDDESEFGGGYNRRQRRKVKENLVADPTAMYDYFDPADIEKGYYTLEDRVIADSDVPERFQLREIPVIKPSDVSGATDYTEEATYIYEHAFGRFGQVSSQHIPPSRRICYTRMEGGAGHQLALASQYEHLAQTKPAIVIPIISTVLGFLRDKLMEVPFINFYRKEALGGHLTINDLWKIYKLDAVWTALNDRRQNILRRLTRMQSYVYHRLELEEQSTEQGIITSEMPSILIDDIALGRKSDNVEELRDIMEHFHLHFGHLVRPMLEWERQEKLKSKPSRKKAHSDNPNADEQGESDADTTGVHSDEDEEEEEDEELITQKPSKMNSLYNLGKRTGILKLIKEFGLTAQQFAENLTDDYQKHEVKQSGPKSAAQEFLKPPILCTEEQVWTVARYLLAKQVATEPRVVAILRRQLLMRGKLHVKPTRRRRDEIDESHPLYPVKYLKDYHICDLYGDIFLQIDQASSGKHKLIDYEITMDPKDAERTYLDEVRVFFQRDEFSEVAKYWDEQRYQILRLAFEGMLYPKLIKELRHKLLRECHEGIVEQSQQALHNILKCSPFPRDEMMLEEDFNQMDAEQSHLNESTKDGISAQALAMAFEDDRSAPFGVNILVFGVVLNGWGLPVETIKLQHIMRSPYAKSREDLEARQRDIRRLSDLVHRRRPHILVIAAESRLAMNFQETLRTMVNDMESDRRLPHHIPVDLIDNGPAIVYSNSKMAQAEFPDYSRVMRQAIGLGRRVQDPLLELSRLVNWEDDFLSVRWHPMQHLVPKNHLKRALELEFVNRTNDVGVDINRCLDYPHTSSVLQFVAGLGPRKAFYLLQCFKTRNVRLTSRMHLVSIGQVTPHVLINCAAFIKLDPRLSGFGDLEVDDTLSGGVKRSPLDCTRIHPESYPLAGKMALDALEYEEQDSDEKTPQAIREVLQAPERLRDLDLDAFAEELKRQDHGAKHITLYDIRKELTSPYKDFRDSYQPPSNEERFELIAKELPEFFYVGKLSNCRVLRVIRRKPGQEQLDSANPVRDENTMMWICPFCQQNDITELTSMWEHFDSNDCPGEPIGIRCVLDNGVFGYLPIRSLSDQPVNNLFERVQLGDIIQARITRIDLERLSVDLTSKGSDLRDYENRWKPQRDFFYDYKQEEFDENELREKENRRRGPRYLTRMIFHPNFQNISYSEFVKKIPKMEKGDMVFRPSSLGSNHLTVSWKVDDNIVQHIDILEHKKEKDYTLGKVLKIGNEMFEDLDEIAARYITPMVYYAREIMEFKNYISTDGGVKEMMLGIVHREKVSNPERIPYYFTSCKSCPGKFILFYMPGQRLYQEYVTITYVGFKFRKEIFPNLLSLIKHFKESIVRGTGRG